MNSTQIFLTLNSLLKPEFITHSNSFRDFLILLVSQNAKPQKVEICIENLKNFFSLDLVLNLSQSEFELLIKPSGFYKTKAKLIKDILKAIKKDFENYENFVQNASKDWLLNIKGVGNLNADLMSCYILKKDIFIVDSNALKIANILNFEFETYEDISEFFSSIDVDKINQTLQTDLNTNEIFIVYHEMIFRFVKEFLKQDRLNEFLENI